ncbi:class I SAM-dependent methyltransferase [Effusibacillus lacus]|uniref:SAM-dependent methyltransferase n=1 Tax=Effusibacillus lacus TaxID=1348429 RepID=A0A292YNT3_9BACL|nr:class I SAM-dependent methyltransferase [Effusibacillus lacus]TCS74938.1 ubiquinone/menaquinone biosynthesis C-methylase UbiE [Effusibacillus lacus]GAX91608.1 SAM-dependent methyltransferase [Effusibacillus lacus]
MTDSQKEIWDTLWSQRVSYHWDSLSETIYGTICRFIRDVKGKALLEAGSGTGKISLRLAMEGADVTLVDYSKKALENSQLAFRQKNRQGNFLLSDIRNMEVPDNSYDLVWNAGVLEHFDFSGKVSVLQEMARITKPEGIVLVFTPFAKCLPYRVGKAFAETYGSWMYGQEEPVHSLKHEFAASGITLLEEFDDGFVNSLDFLDFIPGSQPVKRWIQQWYEKLTKEEQSIFPGYLLVSAGSPASFHKGN